MKRTMIVVSVAMLLVFHTAALAASSHAGHNAGGNDGPMGGTFKHHEMVDGTRAEFQIMSLASMNMQDPGGATHHIMVKLTGPGQDRPVADAVGRIKVIAPSGESQEAALKNYGGVLAANFSFGVPGRYGVICLFVDQGQKKVVKFWYSHKG